MSTQQQPFWRGQRGRLLLASLAGLVAVGIVLGLVIAWASTTVLEAAGIDGSGDPTRPAPTSEEPSGSGSSDETPTDDPTETETDDTESTTDEPLEPALQASATQVSSYQEVQLTGQFPGLPAGRPLQIERKEGGSWTLFPVSVSTSELGRFSINIATGQPGPNLFRVTDPQTGISTSTVTITVG